MITQPYCELAILTKSLSNIPYLEVYQISLSGALISVLKSHSRPPSERISGENLANELRDTMETEGAISSGMIGRQEDR